MRVRDIRFTNILSFSYKLTYNKYINKQPPSGRLLPLSSDSTLSINNNFLKLVFHYCRLDLSLSMTNGIQFAKLYRREYSPNARCPVCYEIYNTKYIEYCFNVIQTNDIWLTKQLLYSIIFLNVVREWFIYYTNYK